MTREVVETAVREGIPFAIQMADGKEYEIHNQVHIAIAKTYVVVIGKDELPHVLPLLTMTGLSYLKPPDQRAT
jgi:hypothetical protein